MSTQWQFRAASVILIALSGCSHPSYTGEVRTTLKGTFGSDSTFKNYTFLGNPVGTYIAGTMFLDQLQQSGATPESRWIVGYPLTWWASGVDTPEARRLLARIIVPGSFGSRAVNRAISTKLGLEVAVPKIEQVVSGGASIDFEKGVNVTIKASEAVQREVNLDELEDAFSQGKIKESVRQRWQQGNFVIIGADIVLLGYTATVKVDQSVNPTLNAKLEELAGGQVGGGSLKLTVKKTASGTFEVSASEPVVAAFDLRRAPADVQLGEATIRDWEPVGIASDLLAPVDSLLRQEQP